MPLSSTSLIHLTGSLDNIFSILREGFYPKYCVESLYSKKRSEKLELAFPMISFSDIPLSELKNHLNSYGHYGLGLTKEWARENGLNPILYLDHSSYFIDSLFSMHDKVAENYNYYKGNDNLLFLTYSILRNSKNYEGNLERKNVKIENYRFSDEREWRYIPKDIDLQKFNGEFFIPAHIYNRKKSFYNIPLQSIRVKLKAKHIKYIIIKDEKEIRTTIDFIKDFVKTKYPKLQEKLISRILTTNQILNDF